MPRPRRATDLFLSLGLAAAAVGWPGVGMAPVQAQHLHPSGHGRSVPSSAPGDGGAGREAAEADHGQRAIGTRDLLVVLAQMQGHLLMAEELLAAGEARAAEPHVAHPADELYGTLEEAIAAGRLPAFRDSLESLRQRQRLMPASADTTRALAEAQRAIATASAAVAPDLAGDPALTLAVVRSLAAAAAGEYDSAVADGRIVETIDYQDARGFLRQADRLLARSSATSSAAAAALQPARGRIAAMLEAFPGPRPPERIRLSVSQLQALAGAI